MTRASHRLWLCALCAAWSTAAAGCGVGLDDDCSTSTEWKLLDARDVRVEGRLRLEYRMVLTITAEGASSEARDELRTAPLRFSVSPGDVRVGSVGFSTADGSDVTYESSIYAGWYIAYLENAMGGCGDGECSREFLAWAEVGGEGLVDVRSDLAIPVTNCGEKGAWLRFDVERTDPPDASTAPLDGGVGP